jgi:hypothetical protein
MSPTVWAMALLVNAAPGAGQVTELEGFAATEIPAGACGPIAIADIDGDGAVEIVVTCGASISVLERDGKMRPGFPVAVGRGNATPTVIKAGAALCDVDGDRRLDVVAGADDRRLYVVNGRGESVSGFPVTLRGLPRALPSCVPLGDAADGVVLSVDSGQLLLVQARQGAPRVLAQIGEGAEGGVAAADIDGHGTIDLSTVGGDGVLHRVDLKGRTPATSRYAMSFRSSGAPAVGDLDDDGHFDWVVGSQDFKVHAVSATGRSLPGFPVDTGYRIYAGVALADIDGDGAPEVIAGSGDGELHVVKGSGALLRGFPVKLDGRVLADPVVGDLDKDGRPEIVVGTQGGSLYILTASGQNVAGSPIAVGGKIEGAPALFDLDGDGVLEIVVASTGSVHAYRLKTRGKAERALAPWPFAAHDVRRSGRSGPHEGRFKDLGYVNARPTVRDGLEVRYRFFNLDGGAETGTQIRWYKDGKRVPELDNARRVDRSLTRKHEHWRYTLQAGENFQAFGEAGVLARTFAAPEVVIENTPPSAPGVELLPASPRVSARLEVKVAKASSDVDGDRVTYRYTWLKDEVPQAMPATVTSIEPGRTHKHEVWRVVVVADDGEARSEPATATVTIDNTPPAAPKVLFSPAAPRIDDEVQVVVAAPATDDDRDPVHYSYAYDVDGVPLNLPPSASAVPARTLRKHQRLHVVVTAWDDEAAGGKSEARAEVHNTAPPKPTIGLWPPHPRQRDDLRLQVLAAAEDCDRDAVVLRHQWYRDGSKVDFGDTLPASALRKGQRWRIEVVPWDGEESGVAAAAETRVENTPPEPPLLALDRYDFFTDEDVAPRVLVPAHDDDGDAVELRYVWYQGGKAQKFSPHKASLSAAETHRDQSWEVEVTPFDGEASGQPTRLTFHVRNSPPTAPAVTLSTNEPTVLDRVFVRVTTAARDKDGDALSYRYRWYRNGQLLADWPVTKAALEPQEMRKSEHWRVDVRAYDGTEESPPGFAELRVRNHAPDPPQIAIAPATPRASDALHCRIVKPAIDVDGDTLAYETTWFVGGVALPLPPERDGSLTSLARKGQAWSCSVTANDGSSRSQVARAAPVTIADTLPAAPGIVIEPAEPRTSDDLVCAVARPSVDLDLDRVSYRYTWRRNGKPFRPGDAAAPEHITHTATRRGESWECTVTPSDGTAEGAGASTHVTIRNTPPTAPRVALKPASPHGNEAIACEVTLPAADADGDAVHYLYTWLKNGVPQPFAPTSTAVPARLVKAKDAWRCAVAARDDADTGPAGLTPEVVVLEPSNASAQAQR